MPLRDHFRPPVSRRHGWEEFHAVWPTTIVQDLRSRLPAGFVAAPRVHLGQVVEIDLGTFEEDDPPPRPRAAGGAAVAWAPATPLMRVETEVPEEAEYEVRVYDADRGRTLVAVVEIVSPANLDRPEHRTAFAAKCAALLRRGVAVSVVDLVTVRHHNLYAEVRDLVGHPDPAMPAADAPPTYAASCRWLRGGPRAVLESWAAPMAVGDRLPTIPLWLADELVIPLDLEVSYERACHDLWIE